MTKPFLSYISIILFQSFLLYFANVEGLRIFAHTNHQLYMSTVESRNPIIVGGGPAGLATALMLAQRGISCKVYERLGVYAPASDSSIYGDFEASRAYNVGLNGRGQKVLKALGVMDRIEQFTSTVVGRKDWSPDSIEIPKENIFSGKSYLTKCITRDRLAACLFDEIKENFSDKIEVNFGVTCKNMVWLNEGEENESCRLTFSRDICDVTSKGTNTVLYKLQKRVYKNEPSQ